MQFKSLGFQGVSSVGMNNNLIVAVQVQISTNPGQASHKVCKKPRNSMAAVALSSARRMLMQDAGFVRSGVVTVVTLLAAAT